MLVGPSLEKPKVTSLIFRRMDAWRNRLLQLNGPVPRSVALFSLAGSPAPRFGTPDRRTLRSWKMDLFSIFYRFSLRERRANAISPLILDRYPPPELNTDRGE